MKRNVLSYFAIIIALICIHKSQGQTVQFNAYSYWNAEKGLTPCRPSGELQYGGPGQKDCANYYGLDTPPRVQGRWGTPSGGTQQSGLGFDSVSGTTPVNADFFLGTLTHFNFPIDIGSAISSIINSILFNVQVNGQQVATGVYNFTFLVDETPNNKYPCPYPGHTNCSDKISFQSIPTTQQGFTLGSVQYNLYMVGFKESNVSSSNPVTYFYSDENQQSKAYLFGRIAAACPASCANGGQPVLINNYNCACNCSGTKCPHSLQTTAANCTCYCPNSCANGGTLNADCSCTCPTCAAPKITNADCSCSCPTNYCNSGTISNSNCGCDCSSLPACTVPNETRNTTCLCGCNLQCTGNRKLDPTPGVCNCICSNQTCPTNFKINQTTCGCDCNRDCGYSTLNTQSCTCGPCTGNWTKDASGACTVCGLSASTCTAASEVLDSASCSCVCSGLNCNLYTNGTVVDTTKPCACRPCKAGECYCGNGRVEPGEQCDSPGNPCCSNTCQFTYSPCTDNNACTISDTCNGMGNCTGEYKCPLTAECGTITCDQNIGTCNLNPYPNGTSCGDGNLCQSRCISGYCDNSTTICPADNSTTDCMIPICDPSTGMCPYHIVANISCSDGNGCTASDTCYSNGTCAGTPVVCPISSDPCKINVCSLGSCVANPRPDGTSCNKDNSNCTVGDACQSGVCIAGPLTVCNATDDCKLAICNVGSGLCEQSPQPLNFTCNDNNVCTINDRCVNGTCIGDINPALASAVQCGGVLSNPAKSANTNSIIIFSVLGGAALIGAIAGLAVLVKKVRDSKLLDPDTWDPDKFSSVGSNPLYKGSGANVNNILYDGAN